MIYKSTIQLLRIPFSINLLPIFLFALYCSQGHIYPLKGLLVFILIHFVFYPASNAYNSYMDNDTGSIAGIKSPPAPTKQLFQVSLMLDVLGLGLSLLISLPFFIINLILVLLSRAYSYRGIRIKKYAIASFVTVALAQGGLSFYNMFLGIQGLDNFPRIDIDLFLKIAAATLFVGAIYPITQIYQHEDDKANGDRTLSLLLGVKGTFLFSGLLFILSNVLLFFILPTDAFVLFEICMIAPACYFVYWMIKAFKNPRYVDFNHTMTMAMTASLAMILGFGIILFIG